MTQKSFEIGHIVAVSTSPATFNTAEVIKVNRCSVVVKYDNGTTKRQPLEKVSHRYSAGPTKAR